MQEDGSYDVDDNKLKTTNIHLTVFLTNELSGFVSTDGLLGVSPCPNGLEDYSFAH